MIRNLSKIGLGVANRQNEMIELALTNGFAAIEIDMDDMVGRAESFGNDFACQFIKSCKVNPGIFELPIDFDASDEAYQKSLDRLAHILELAEATQANRCYVEISPASNEMPYHENFEKQRVRIVALAEKLAGKNIQLGLVLNALESARQGKNHEFIYKVEDLLTFVKAIGQPNVGIAFDAFHWVIGGGSRDQFESLGVNEIIDVRLSDVSSEIDLSKATNGARLLPKSDDDSICQSVYDWLVKNEYSGTLAVCASSRNLDSENPQQIVAQYKRILDLLDGKEIPSSEVVAEAEPVATAE